MKDNSYWISPRYKTSGLRVYQLLQDKVFDVYKETIAEGHMLAGHHHTLVLADDRKWLL